MTLRTAYGPMTVTEAEFARIAPIRENETAKRVLVWTKQILGGTVLDHGAQQWRGFQAITRPDEVGGRKR